jgi:methyl-accepting chemotaxis protein
MSRLANGDLTRSLSISSQAIAISSEDEVGMMAHMFNSVIGRLQEVGEAFEKMTHNLNDALNLVSQNAVQVPQRLRPAGQRRRPVRAGRVSDRHHHPADRPRRFAAV